MEQILLPAYESIPDIGLYLDQTVRFLNEYTVAFGEELTGSMITNYVKLKIVPKSKGKLYNRKQIALFLLVAICKKVLTMDQIRQLVSYIYDEVELYYQAFKNALLGQLEEDDNKMIIINKIIDIIVEKRELDKILGAVKK